MSRPTEGKTAAVPGPADASASPGRMVARSGPVPGDLQDALDGSACLGAWSYDLREDRLVLSVPLAGLLGLATEAAEFGLAQVLTGIHAEDRLRIESTLFAATEAGGPFEAEFRTRPGAGGVRWLRLMGRCEHDPAGGKARTRGLAFDLTEGRRPAGTPAQRAQRQVNQLADHVIAMQGLAASLSNPPLAKAVHDVAVEVGHEIARRLRAEELGPQH